MNPFTVYKIYSRTDKRFVLEEVQSFADLKEVKALAQTFESYLLEKVADEVSVEENKDMTSKFIVGSEYGKSNKRLLIHTREITMKFSASVELQVNQKQFPEKNFSIYKVHK